MRRSMKASIVSLVATGAVLVMSAPGFTQGAEVTSGDFQVFATGVGNTAYDNVSGRAQMVRTAEGKTIVKVNVSGLAANTAYLAHVHTLACGTNAANGHYRFDPAGPANSTNELWPGFTTDSDGSGSGKAVSPMTAGSTAVSVVIHTAAGAKILCADLA